MTVDDEADIRAIIRGTLSSKYEVAEAGDGLDALEKLDIVEPDFVILDVNMPLMDGLQTCESIRKHPRYHDVSVLFLSGQNTREDMMKGYSAGANLYLTKPFEPVRLLRNVDLFFETNPPQLRTKRYTLEQIKQMEQSGAGALAAARSPRAIPSAADAAPKAARPRVLIVDDDAPLLASLRSFLADEYEIVTANDGIEAIEKITSCQPDLVVLDAVMPRMSGFQLCTSLRRNARYTKMPLMIISEKATPRDRDYALRLGANDFLAKPVELSQVRECLAAMRKAPDFKIYPKAVPYSVILEMENRAKHETENSPWRMMHKEETELEKFLRENT
ncbi:MAG: response regulator [bacterium]|nr:response regulator [Candidatus Sumerlaeota bacterium]